MTRAEKIKKLKKQCDELWSKAVRTRDGMCILCGKREGLNAHHWIKSKAQGNLQRHNVKNGVTLCMPCHIYKVHSYASADILDQLRKAALARGIVTENDIASIEADHSLAKLTVEDLEQRKRYLQDYLERLDPNFYGVGGTDD